MPIGFGMLGVLVNDGLLRISRMECPAIAPAHVKRPFRSVKIATDGMLLGGVARELAMLPSGRERFEFIDRNLSIGGIGGLLLVVQDGLAADRTAAS